VDRHEFLEDLARKLIIAAVLNCGNVDSRQRDGLNLIQVSNSLRSEITGRGIAILSMKRARKCRLAGIASPTGCAFDAQLPVQ